MERPLNNYQVTMFHYVGDERREQVISVRDLAYAMQAILAYDEQEDVEPEASALDEVVTWARRVCGSLAPLTSGSPLDRLSDALQRLDREEVRAI